MENEINQGGIDKLATALSKFQGEVLNAHKSKQGYGYNYADLASVLDIARPLLAKNGLSVLQMPVLSNEGMMRLQTILMHESGQSVEGFFEMPVPAEAKGMTRAQATGSVLTYMRRYALAAVLGIAQDDNDAAAQLSERAALASDNEILAQIQNAQSADEVKQIMDGLDDRTKSKYRAVGAAKFKSFGGLNG